MTRRELLAAGLVASRIALLRLRMRIGRPVPALTAVLAWLDAWALAIERRGRR